jgi:hypothetical protein
MHYNNPEPIAWWEYPIIWPTKRKYPDLMLSIGTGWAPDKFNLSTLKSTTMAGMYNAFSRSLSGRRQSKETVNWLPKDARNLYYRMDLQLDTKEPQIDDVSMIDVLRMQAESMLITEENVLRRFIDHWLATLFFIDLETVVEKQSTTHALLAYISGKRFQSKV